MSTNGNIYIDGLTNSLTKVVKKDNAQVFLNAKSSIIVNDVKYSAAGYNFLEIPAWSKLTPYKPTSIKISNVKHDGELTHNGISIYSVADNAEIVLENIDIQNMGVGSGDGQFLRLSNLGKAQNVTVTVKNCHMTNTYYGNPFDELWATFGFAQDDFTSTEGSEDYTSWKLNFIDCTYNGDPVLLENKNVFTIWRSKIASPANYVKAGEQGAPQITTTCNLSAAKLDELKQRYLALCAKYNKTPGSNPNISAE